MRRSILIVLFLGVFGIYQGVAQSQFCIDHPNHPNCKKNNTWEPADGNPNVPISNNYAITLLGIAGVGVAGAFLMRKNNQLVKDD